MFYNYNFFHFLCSWNMFKIWIWISNFTWFKHLIFWLHQLHVNHNTCLSTYYNYHTKVLKIVIFHSTCYLKVHDSHSSDLCFTFSFNNYTFKFNGVLNNTLFMFWNMNIKLQLKFLNYTPWLQIVLYALNLNILFHMKGTTCLG